MGPSDAANRRPVSFDAPPNREVGEPGHGKNREPAGIDPIEGREIEVDVDRDAVERASVAYAKPDRGDLPAFHVDARRALAPGCRDARTAEHVDDRLLQRLDNPAYADLRTAQIEEQIGHELTGPMVGHLPSSIGANHGNRSGLSHMAAPSGLSERKDRGVLEQPELIGRVDARGFRTQPHRLHRLAVRHASEPAHEQRRRIRYRGCVT